MAPTSRQASASIRMQQQQQPPPTTTTSRRHNRLLLAVIIQALVICLFMVSMSFHFFFLSSSTVPSSSSSLVMPILLPLEETSQVDTRPTETMEDICSGCLLALRNNGQGPSCGKMIHDELKKNSSRTLVEAGKIVASQYMTTCQKCNGETCQHETDAERTYWRFDDLVQPQITYARSHSLDVPSMFRLPYLSTESGNMTTYFANGNMRIPNRTYLFEYNPTLAHLPKDQIPSNLDRTQSYYLGILRLASINECLTKEQRTQLLDPLNKFYPGTEMMGFVIMDTKLNILQQSIKYHFNYIDHRLFNLNGELYLGYMHQVNRLRIGEPPTLHVNNTTTTTADPSFQRLRNYGSQSFRNDFDVYISKHSTCCTSDLCRGKNFNYFVDKHGTIMVETKPFGAHVVESIAFQERCKVAHLRSTLLNYAEERELSTQFQEGKNDINNGTASVYVSSFIPPESFHTQDEIYFPQHQVYQPPETPDRGTACCVKIPDPRYSSPTQHKRQQQGVDDDPYLLVGVSHSKYPGWKQIVEMKESKPGLDFPLRGYMSRLYAFEPFPPYRTVARSGKFCLPMPNVTSTEAIENPNVHYLPQNMFHFAGNVLSCPLIHFVSSIIEAIDDPTNVILGYGVNDCTSRMVQIPKSELLRILFPPTKQQ
jgi:hypothetical protein